MDAPNNTTQPQDPQVAVPKENSPPPAYTPRRAADIPSLTARAIQARQGLASMVQALQQTQHQQAPFATLLPGAVSDDQDEPSEDSSPISLRINTAVNVSQSNNFLSTRAALEDAAFP
ncbi:hypothetical protein NM208_g17134 [Fusarium decemcellulare]|uniref:Uncharacterized protein n=1 Tax=Fusarium decemcellulare TaxID=57161 RepID=A0ACC1RAS7_9HYPO|nr:hypothetical protein NM208_g17134 [Fusarium decemcellulare]